MKTFFFILLTFIVSDAALATPKELIRAAEEAYARGQFEIARDRYEEVLQHGLENGHLYYNLGNSEYRLGRIGHAIVSYRRAAALLPRDRDISANLELARRSAGTYLGGEGMLRLLAPSGFLTPRERDAALFITSLAVLLFLAVRLISPKRELRRFLFPTLLAALWFAADFALSTHDARGNIRFSLIREYSPAVVLADTAIYEAPSESSRRGEELRPGAEIEVKLYGGEWVRVIRADEKEGWIKRAAVGLAPSPV